VCIALLKALLSMFPNIVVDGGGGGGGGGGGNSSSRVMIHLANSPR